MSEPSKGSVDSTTNDDTPMYRTEDFNKYMPGGYHPIELGDVLVDRYRIIHRLGHGGYSTVWLAVDQAYDEMLPPNRFSQRYVAIKICTSDSGGGELAILERLRFQGPSEGPFSWLRGWLSFPRGDGLEHILAVLDAFPVTGPNGVHCCIVTDFLGPSVGAVHAHHARATGGRHLLPLDVARGVAMQCAEAVQDLHARGIVHADLHVGNFAFVPTVDINSWTVEQVYDALGGEPVRMTIEDVAEYGVHDMSDWDGNLDEYDDSHRPSYLVAPPPTRHLWSLCNTSPPKIRVIDFSEAFVLPLDMEQKLHFGVPDAFRAPELLCGFWEDVSSPIDVWALGCSIFQVLNGSSPFSSREPLPQITVLAGLGGKENIPEKYWKAFTKYQSLEDVEREKTIGKHIPRTWANLFRGEIGKLSQVTVDKVEIPPLKPKDEEVLKKVIAAFSSVDPAKRQSAKKILRIMQAGWAPSEGILAMLRR